MVSLPVLFITIFISIVVLLYLINAFILLDFILSSEEFWLLIRIGLFFSTMITVMYGYLY